MTEDLLDYWLRIIRPLFPAHAWMVASLSKGDHLIQIDWRLADEPDKRSRKIEIIIREEIVDRYLDQNKTERAQSDTKMKTWISERYQAFNPYYDAHESRYTSAEKWRISKDILDP